MPASPTDRPALAALLGALALAVAVSGCTTLPGQRSVETEHGTHQVATAGTGSPTLVFDAGAGEGLTTWHDLFPAAARHSRVFAYSRRGYDGTWPALRHRDGLTLVRELHALLQAERMKPPYVLVGHSLGGFNLALYARVYPDEVAGLVLIDPTTPDHLARLKAERPANYAALRVLGGINLATTLAAEIRGSEEAPAQWRASGPLPRVPVVVLTALRAYALEGAGFAEFKARLQTEFVSQWPGARQVRVDCGHFIHHERPDAVLSAIQEVLREARARSQHSHPPTSSLSHE